MNIIKLNLRPLCQVPGCNEQGALNKTNKKTGWKTWRKQCGRHHNKQISDRHGLKNMQEVVAKNAGFDNVMAYKNHQAKKRGFTSHYALLDYIAVAKGFKNHVDYTNSKHPYLKWRKEYCENIDGRLGYICTSTIVWLGQLDVDHKDGDPSNNAEKNCQTLCKCCHAYKTNQEKDWLTPGRKALGIKY